jgi:hypothetical protein
LGVLGRLPDVELLDGIDEGNFHVHAFGHDDGANLAKANEDARVSGLHDLEATEHGTKKQNQNQKADQEPDNGGGVGIHFSGATLAGDASSGDWKTTASFQGGEIKKRATVWPPVFEKLILIGSIRRRVRPR